MGGGAIRTAAKAVALAGARRPTYSPATAAANTVHVSSMGETQSSVSIFSSEKEKLVPVGNQWPAWDLNDWELAGGKEEESLLVSDLVDPPSRVVFGSVPTLEEAKEATSDLKDALEKVYFSPLVDEAPVKVSKVSEPAESRAILPAIPKHVVQAFSLLQGSPQAQNVVASLASDQNVWEAVMKNEKVIDFYKNHHSVPPETKAFDESARESSVSVESPLRNEKPEGSIFTGLVQSIKVKVSEIAGSISDLLQDFMGTSSETNVQTNTKTSTSTSDGHVSLGATFMALAVACILVVIFKRG